MTTTTPNMNLILPDVSITAGPQWATLLNAAYALIDSHDHTTGKGALITPAGLNISSDLTFAQNNATNLRTVRLYPNNTFTPTGTDRTCLYALGGELYYVDSAGNNVQLTLNGSVDVTGSITALSLKDSSFFLQYFGDVTRQFRFNASAIPTGTTRVLSVPDSGANDTFVTVNATQTLTNKTLTTPVIAALNTGSTAFTLPVADGTTGQVIQTNGSGTLSFVNAASTAGNVAANDSNVTFTNANSRAQYCTPTAPRTYTMPTTSIVAGDTWTFYNSATSAANFITLQSSGANTIAVVPPQGFITLFAAVATPTTAANWVVTDVQSKWVSYTPTISGLGTVSSLGAFYKISRDMMTVHVYFTTGTPAAALASCTIPTSYTISGAKSPVNNNTGSPGAQVGTYGGNGGSTSGMLITATSGGDSNIYFGAGFTAANNLTPSNGSSIIGGSAVMTLKFEVPLA